MLGSLHNRVANLSDNRNVAAAVLAIATAKDLNTNSDGKAFADGREN